MSTDDRVAKLEEQITSLHDQQADLRKQQADLRKQQADLRKQLAKAQLDQWQGRFEAMEVQMRLGTVKATDKASALMDQLARKWADARKQFEESVSTASGVADTVRTGLENAYAELRKALLESRSQLESKNKPA
jgi:chromosome segregation ATPase